MILLSVQCNVACIERSLNRSWNVNSTQLLFNTGEPTKEKNQPNCSLKTRSNGHEFVAFEKKMKEKRKHEKALSPALFKFFN